MIKIQYPNQQTLDTYFDEIKIELLKKIVEKELKYLNEDKINIYYFGFPYYLKLIFKTSQNLKFFYIAIQDRYF